MRDIKFVIIASGKNNERWIERHLKSVLLQKYSNYEHYYLDDNSSDLTLEKYKKIILNDERFNILYNEDKLQTNHFNITNRLDLFNKEEYSDDVVFIYLDGDDWFFSTEVLNYLNKAYQEEDLLLTYGNFVEYPSGRKSTIVSPHPSHVIEQRSFRKDSWRASHLKTFKKKIAKRLSLDDYTINNKLTFVGDQATMLSLLEMAGERHKCIEKILYVYNRANPGNYDKKKDIFQEMLKQEKELRKKPPRKLIR